MAGFKIPSIPPTTNKTIRFPNDVIEKVERAIVGKDCTFSAFVIAAVRAALEELKEEGELPSPNSGWKLQTHRPVTGGGGRRQCVCGRARMDWDRRWVFPWVCPFYFVEKTPVRLYKSRGFVKIDRLCK